MRTKKQNQKQKQNRIIFYVLATPIISAVGGYGIFTLYSVLGYPGTFNLFIALMSSSLYTIIIFPNKK